MNPADSVDQSDQLRELARTVAARMGYDLEELVVVAAGRRRLIRIVVDGDHGVSLDAAAEISRAIGAALDVEGDTFIGPEPYTLEVTSPGIGRPLTEERHFRRARGRVVLAKMLDGGTVEGRVRRVADNALELLTGPDAAITVIPLADIRRAKVDVEFAKMPAAHAELLAADGFIDPARAFDDGEADEAETDGADDCAQAEPDVTDGPDEADRADYFDGGLLDSDEFDEEQDPHTHTGGSAEAPFRKAGEGQQ